MNKQELEEYEMLGEKLICIPSGLKRKDGTDVMSLTLRKWVEEEKTEENNTYVEYEDTIEYEIKDCYLIKEDEEKYIYENKPEEENDKKGEKETKLQSKSVTNSEHDKLFKSLFSNVEETAEFLNKELNLVYKFKANNMQQYNKEYITNMFEKIESDIVYKVEEKKLYVLIEHQSSPDRSMPYRMEKYRIEIMDSGLEKRKMRLVDYKYPRVIPIVLYTGIRKWNVPELEDLQYKVEGYEENNKYYILIDANKYTREELLHDNLIITKAMLLDREEDINDIKKDLDIIIDKEKIKKSTRYKEQLLILLQYLFINEKYIAIRADLQRLIEELKGDDEPVLRAAKIIDEEFEEAERRGEKRGEKKGKQEVAKAMKEDKLSYEFISKFTGLKLEEIEAL